MGSIFLAWRYLQRHPFRTILMILVLGLAFSLPLALVVLGRAVEREWYSRAQSTALVLGAEGSPLDLTLHALYHRPMRQGTTFPIGALDRLIPPDLAKSIPIYHAHRSAGSPIVGVSLAYFTFRHLKISQGQMMTRLGDCVLGADVAAKLSLTPGSSLLTTPDQIFHLGGAFPLQMRVSAILQRSHTPDDQAIFVDLKTAWLIAGLAHGHDDPAPVPSGTLAPLGPGTLTHSVVTPQNLSSFHFHGDPQQFPLSAAIIIPRDTKAQALLLGRFAADRQWAQLTIPHEEMAALLTNILEVKALIQALLLALITLILILIGLMIWLTFRLRAREFSTLRDLGVSRINLCKTIMWEVVIVLLVSFVLACCVNFFLSLSSHRIVQNFTVISNK